MLPAKKALLVSIEEIFVTVSKGFILKHRFMETVQMNNFGKVFARRTFSGRHSGPSDGNNSDYFIAFPNIENFLTGFMVH
jgi:hypothetical protein